MINDDEFIMNNLNLNSQRCQWQTHSSQCDFLVKSVRDII